MNKMELLQPFNFTTNYNEDPNDNAIFTNLKNYKTTDNIYSQEKYDFDILETRNINNFNLLDIDDLIDSTNFISNSKVRIKLSEEIFFEKPCIDQKVFKNYSSILLNIIENDIFEPGTVSKTESYIEVLLKKDNTGTMEWLNTLFVDYFRNEHVILGILHVISHFDYQIVYPSGQIIALAALNHKSIEVKEYAVRAFENWGEQSSLNILKNLDLKEHWLQQYIDQVILDLEGEMNAHVLFGQENFTGKVAE